MKHKTVQLTRLVVVGFLLMGMCSALFGQNRGIAIKGAIVDTEGIPVIGASVLVKGTTTGVAADMDGKFLLFPESPQSWRCPQSVTSPRKSRSASKRF